MESNDFKAMAKNDSLPTALTDTCKHSSQCTQLSQALQLQQLSSTADTNKYRNQHPQQQAAITFIATGSLSFQLQLQP